MSSGASPRSAGTFVLSCLHREGFVRRFCISAKELVLWRHKPGLGK